MATTDLICAVKVQPSWCPTLLVCLSCYVLPDGQLASISEKVGETQVFLLACCRKCTAKRHECLVNWTHISFTDGQLACLCDRPKCLQATQCHGARCFSSVKVSSSGVVFERGCLDGPQKIRLHCSTPPSLHQAIFCCSQDMCNSNTTTSSLMSLLPTGGYYSITCFMLARKWIIK